MSKWGFSDNRYSGNHNNNNKRGGSQWRQPQNNNQQGNYQQPSFQNQFMPQMQQQGYEESPAPSGFRPKPRKGGISKVKENVRKPVVVDSLPTGQHLSKTTSELKNDPLYLEAFFPNPSEELRPIAEELNHFSGFDGLPLLVNETYENFSAHNLNFKRSVSLSAYNYYITVLTWARALWLKKQNRYRLTTNELEFVDMIYSQGNYTLPKTISIYLSGFGNFNIPSGPESKFNLKEYTYDENGYFENFDRLFYLCTSYPNISIAAERIMRDLMFTANPDVGEEWSPNELEHEWNNRCIGYHNSVTLQSMQQQVLDRAGIRADNFPTDLNEMLVNVRLLNSVQKYLLEIASLESSPIPTNITGSQGQFIIENTEANAHQMNAADDIGSVTFVSEAPLICPGSLSYLGGSFLYRVNKSLTPSRAKFFFPYVVDPTANNIQILNSLNTGWSPIFDNIIHFSNVPFKPSLRIKKFCSIDVKMSST